MPSFHQLMPHLSAIRYVTTQDSEFLNLLMQHDQDHRLTGGGFISRSLTPIGPPEEDIEVRAVYHPSDGQVYALPDIAIVLRMDFGVVQSVVQAAHEAEPLREE